VKRLQKFILEALRLAVALVLALPFAVLSWIGYGIDNGRKKLENGLDDFMPIRLTGRYRKRKLCASCPLVWRQRTPENALKRLIAMSKAEL